MAGKILQVGGIARRDLADALHVRVSGEQRLAQLRQRVIGKLLAQHVGQRAQNRPILPRVAGRECGARRHLHPAFGVDVSSGFFRVGRAGQHHVGAHGAAVAVGADIDDESARRDVDLIDAKEEQHVERARRRHLPRIQAALARHEAEIERADARRRAVQHAVAVPTVLHGAKIERRLCRQRRDSRAVGARKARHADEHERVFGLPQRVGKAVARNIGKRLRAGAEVIVSVSQVGLRPDHADGKFAGAPALADARIEDGGLLARVRADDKEGIGRIDAGDGGVEQIGRPAPFGIERRAVGPAIEIGHAKPRHQILERENLLDRGEVADQRAHALGIAACDLCGDRLERLRPGRRTQLAVLAHIRLIEPLRAQAIDHVARLVGNPFLVDVLIGARQNPHHLAAAGIDADGAAERVHDVDQFRLVELPGPRRERIWL